MSEPTLKVNHDRLREIVINAVKSQPDDAVAESLRQEIMWNGIEVKQVADHPGRLVILAGEFPLAFIDAADLEDAEHGVTGGLSTPEGFRK